VRGPRRDEGGPPRPLPEWAAEFDAKTWAQFFLKYEDDDLISVASHGHLSFSGCTRDACGPNSRRKPSADDGRVERRFAI
jgi:hypothetical protein